MLDEPNSENVEPILDIVDAISASTITLEEACSRYPQWADAISQQWRIIRQMEAKLDRWLPVDAESMAWPTAFELPGYTILELIGQGGMGAVYKAYQESLGRTIAVKTLHAASLATATERARLSREAKAVASIDHPNVLKIFEIGEHEGVPYFTMEYVQGSTLDAQLVSGPLPPRAAAKLIGEIARAVHCVHQQGVIHRDIKPSNILITEGGTAKLSDFGLARLTEQTETLTQVGVAIGTPRYMSPEQARGDSRSIQVATDIYSLGAVLFAALTSRPPFIAESNAELLSLVLYADPVSPTLIVPGVPRELSAICIQCLRKSPDERYESAAALAEDLERFLSGRPTIAQPDTFLSGFKRKITKNPLRSLAVLFFGLATLLIVIMQIQLAVDRSALMAQKNAEYLRTVARVDVLLNEALVAMETGNWNEATRQTATAKSLIGQSDRQLNQRISTIADWGKLGQGLESVRLNAFTVANDQLDLTKAHDNYLQLFQAIGLKEIGGDQPELVRVIRKSPISLTLVGSLDHWSTCAPSRDDAEWLEDLAMDIDSQMREWRMAARLQAVFDNPTELSRLLDHAPRSSSSVPYLMSIEVHKACPEQSRLRFLKSVQRFAPHDFWINLRLANTLMYYGKPEEAIGYYQAAEAIRPDVSIVQNNLAVGLSTLRRYDEAIAHFRRAMSLELDMPSIRFRLIETLSLAERHSDVLDEFPLLEKRMPREPRLWTLRGISFEALGRIPEALESHSAAQEIDPSNLQINREYRNCLIRNKDHGVAAEVWRNALSGEYKHSDCYGLAELTLFGGNATEYDRLRKELLTRFGSTQNPYEAERISRAYLLMPASPSELNAIETVSRYATEIDRKAAGGTYAHFQFVKALLLYRQGNLSQSEIILSSDAAPVLGPVPKLIRSMIAAEQKLQSKSRELLNEAIASYDWSIEKARDQDAWICHAFKRQAEELLNRP